MRRAALTCAHEGIVRAEEKEAAKPHKRRSQNQFALGHSKILPSVALSHGVLMTRRRAADGRGTAALVWNIESKSLT